MKQNQKPKTKQKQKNFQPNKTHKQTNQPKTKHASTLFSLRHIKSSQYKISL